MYLPQKLGQHFLINQSAIEKIIASLELKNKETIIEIGPGKGALTIPLIKECEKIGCKLIGIEKDEHLAEWLIGELINWKNAEILKGDVLKDLQKIIYQLGSQQNNYKIVGNIPYYITGKLLRIFSELEIKPSLIVLTIQKEVAERIVAQPPKMNLLAAATQFWAEPKIIGYLKPSDFSPPPEIESTIIKLESKKQKVEPRIAKNYYNLIKILFKQPRKTIFNNLREGLQNKEKTEGLLKKIGLSGQERPQNLSLDMIKKLAELL